MAATLARPGDSTAARRNGANSVAAPSMIRGTALVVWLVFAMRAPFWSRRNAPDLSRSPISSALPWSAVTMVTPPSRSPPRRADPLRALRFRLRELSLQNFPCGCVFHGILPLNPQEVATQSTPKLPLSPGESCHLIHRKVATDSGAKLPGLSEHSDALDLMDNVIVSGLSRALHGSPPDRERFVSRRIESKQVRAVSETADPLESV